MLDKIIEKIQLETSMDKDEIETLIKNKKKELSDLVSTEGAAFIVAKELGVKVSQSEDRKVDIKDIKKGSRRLEIVGKILKIGDIKEFEREGKKGRVLSVYIADKTGPIRLSLWDNQVDMIKDFKEGDFVKITDVYARSDDEIRIGQNGGIYKSDEEFEVNDTKKIERKDLSEVKEGNVYEVRASVVQIFKSNIFYEVCPVCGKRLAKKGDEFICETHGKVEPKYAMVISGVIDDGTDNMRAVFFRDSAEKLLGIKTEEMLKNPNINENSVVGKEFVFTGIVKKNKLFDREEFIVRDVKELDLSEEIRKNINNLTIKI